MIPSRDPDELAEQLHHLAGLVVDVPQHRQRQLDLLVDRLERFLDACTPPPDGHEPDHVGGRLHGQDLHRPGES